MKRVVFSIVSILFTVGVSGQSVKTNSALYWDTVPLFIESNLFSKGAPNKGEFIFHSDRIKISIPKRNDYILADALIRQTKRSLDSLKLLQIEFCVFFQNGLSLEWKPVPASKTLIDTYLPVQSKINIQFRLKGQNKILQQTTLKRVDWRPGLYAYRTSDFSDSLNTKLTAKAIYDDDHLPIGFSLIDDSLLKIPAGKNAELAIVNHLLNKDSCIEFRIVDSVTKSFGKWVETGHLLIIKNLAAKHHYVLEIRYKGDSRVKTYRIHVLPFWWQTALATLSFIFLGVAIVALTSYIVTRRRKKIAQHRIALGIEKYKKEQNKLDPHWLDNMFHTLLGFIRNNQNDLADEYIGKASSILRDKLIHGERLLIPFEDDMKIMKNFISNERLRHAFNYTIHIDPGLENSSIHLPPILWQPSLENAIKHGNAGIIAISILKRGNDLVMEISNSGEFTRVTTAKGFGIPITTERINGWNMANPGSRIQFDLKQVDNEIIARFIFEKWLA
ncbi:MAG: hypothetical protein EPO58_16130 [Chitinophagaceae bacterium]|nr:MAG: hypothetical protein EPO58_16130 [Chitinophagaceae bacterium]